jgi:hypothetical protein
LVEKNVFYKKARVKNKKEFLLKLIKLNNNTDVTLNSVTFSNSNENIL